MTRIVSDGRLASGCVLPAPTNTNVSMELDFMYSKLTRMLRFVHARDVSDLGEVMDLVCYIVPHFVPAIRLRQHSMYDFIPTESRRGIHLHLCSIPSERPRGNLKMGSRNQTLWARCPEETHRGSTHRGLRIFEVGFPLLSYSLGTNGLAPVRQDV
jgi:hypothetical protein